MQTIIISAFRFLEARLAGTLFTGSHGHDPIITLEAKYHMLGKKPKV